MAELLTASRERLGAADDLVAPPITMNAPWCEQGQTVTGGAADIVLMTTRGPEVRINQASDGMTILQALADPVRIDIVRQLAASDGEVSCGQIRVPVTKSTASHHIRTLVSAGVVAEREDGRRKYLRLRRTELDERFPGLIKSILLATAENR